MFNAVSPMILSGLVSAMQACLLLLLAPLVNGIIRKVKAVCQRRQGASILQPYRDLLKIFAKDTVLPPEASWLFYATPSLIFSALLTASLLVPVIWPAQPWGFFGDAIAFVYLLALARFFTLLAAMDTGSVFTAMSSSRESTLSALAEPAMILPLALAGLSAHTLQLGAMASGNLTNGGASILVRLLAFAGFMLLMVVETGRMPVDNQATHLELTMIHEGLLLEHSGKGLALMQWGAALKQIMLLALCANLYFPWGLASTLNRAVLGFALLVFLAKLLALAIAIGVLESSVAKMRLFQVPDLIGASFVLSVLALLSFALMG
jgi:formate hydrogenlyase subunit 4